MAGPDRLRSLDVNNPLSRRLLLRHAARLGAAAFVSGAAPKVARAQFFDNPFKLGVTSGDPLADGFVIWTRLAPDPFEGGGMPPEAVPVNYEIALDENMRRIVQRGAVLARPEVAHSVHVEVSGLEPNRPYWYRFNAGGEASMVGRTRTYPPVGSPAQRFRFAFTSCQHFGQGYFTPYRQMVEDDLDLILHLGDYIYESTWGQRIRAHPAKPATVDEYRNHYAVYRSDVDLQAAHAACPWGVITDDHEVENDWAKDRSSATQDPIEFLKRRTMAYQAYYEHMPLRKIARPRGNEMQIYTSVTFGDLAHIILLDNRQYRSYHACADQYGGVGGKMLRDCAELQAEDRTMLGDVQERWLMSNLRFQGRWKIVAQQQLFASIDETEPGGTRSYWTEGWDGYAASRRRILTGIRDNKVRNAVFVGGDCHQHWVTDLKLNNEDPKDPVLASEFTSTSLCAGTAPTQDWVLGQNPHAKYNEYRYRGYMRAEVTPALWRTDAMAAETLMRPGAPSRVLRSFVIEDGRPGPEPD
jgi:alkaline phosphatase D